MKGLKCHLTKLLSMRFFCFLGFALFCSVLFSLLPSGVANAAEISGKATHFWIGWSNSQAPFADDYDHYDDWHPVGYSNRLNSSSWQNGYDPFQRWYVKNVSFHSGRVINITSAMHQDGTMTITGSVSLIVPIQNTAPAFNDDFDIKYIPSQLKTWDGNAFNLGISLQTDNGDYYNADDITIRFIQNQSTRQDNDVSSIAYRVGFTARFYNWNSNGTYQLNWRLNGNNRTNGGNGSMFAPFMYSTNSTSSSTLLANTLTYWGADTADFSLNITEAGVPDPPASNYDKQFEKLNNGLSDLKSQNTTIIGQNQAIIDNQNKQLEQDKQQYEQDKKEESDRENNLTSDNDSILGLFNFNLLNPFAGIFTLFKDGSSCASIPTLADWLHTEDKQICPWFPTKVRSVLTPVIGLSSTMILFGFVVHWFNRMKETN